MKKYIIGSLIILAVGVLAFRFYQVKRESSFGAISIPESPYLFITTLQSNIGTSDSSMTLNAGTYKNGTSLTGYNCFTVDAGTASAEYMCGTASGTAISSLLRGIDPQNPAATSSALTFAHRRGADVRITDFPILQIVKRLVNGQDGFPNLITYDSSISTSTQSGNLLAFADVAYVNNQTLQGAPTATGTTAGIVKIASRTQVSSGIGQTDAYTLIPSALYFNYTPQSATTVPVSNASGKIAQGWLDLSQAFTFTGVVTHSATTTLATTTVTSATFSQFPTLPAGSPVNTTDAVNKSYVDGLGRTYLVSASTTDVTIGAATTVTTIVATTTIPSNALGTGNILHIKAYINANGGGNAGQNLTFTVKYGSGSVSAVSSTGGGKTWLGYLDVYLYATSTSAQEISLNMPSNSAVTDNVNTVGSTAVDDTQNQNLMITANWATATGLGSTSLTMSHYIIEIIK